MSRVSDARGRVSNSLMTEHGQWRVALLELGLAPHPGAWVGPPELFDEWLWSPVNALLVRAPGEVILVDAGSGILGSWWPFEGYHCDLAGPLAEHRLTPADVDLVVLTHFDFDHAGGLLAGSWPDALELVFRGTAVAIPAEAVAAARGEDPDAPLNVGTRLVGLLEGHGALIEVTDGTNVAPGVRLRAAPGHRPGHAMIEIEDEEPFLFTADTLHHPVHATHPDWDGGADLQPELALATRRAVTCLPSLISPSRRPPVSSSPRSIR